MDKKLLEILACPICKTKLEYSRNERQLICHEHKIAFVVRNDIPIMLMEEAESI